MDDHQRDVEMQQLVADVFEIAAALRRDGEATARGAGQTQSRWQTMWIAATGQLSVAMIARRLGLARQSVQRTADALVDDGLAAYEPNPDHRRSPLLILTDHGREVLQAINGAGRERNLQQAKILSDEGVAELRLLLGRYRQGLDRPAPDSPA
jgi:DNA-binding MarR family transcriptional regulator